MSYSKKTQFPSKSAKHGLTNNIQHLFILFVFEGAKSVEVNRKMHKVTVSGYVDPKKVLKKVQSTGKKKAELWPYVPYTMVAYPYAAGSYDKRAPPGFVRKSEQAQAQPGSTDDKLMSLFSDENPNACTVM